MENQSRRKRRINILKKLRADYSRDELCILFREAMMDDGDDDDDAGAVVAEETVVRLPQSVGPKKGRMTFVESVCDVISFASLEKNQADQWKYLTDRLELEWSVYRRDVHRDFTDRQLRVVESGVDIYVLSIRHVGKGSHFVPWFSIRDSGIPGAGKGLFAEQAFWNGMDIGIYFGGKVTDSPSDNDSMYALFSVDLKENRDAVGGFGSCFPVYMGLHYINDPQHHTYYGQGTTTAKIREKDVAYWNATKKVPPCNCEFKFEMNLQAVTDIPAGTELFTDYQRGPFYDRTKRSKYSPKK